MQHDWSKVDDTAMAVLRQHDGAAKLAHFLAAGLAPKQVAAAFRRSVIERPRSGWYADPALPWQAKCALRVGGVLSCVSAVDSFGLPVPQESRSRVHVLIPGNAPRQRHSRDRRHYVVPGEDREVMTHWSREDGQQSGWRTALVRSLVQAADCMPADWWIAAVDAALHRPRDGEPLMSEPEFGELAAALPIRLRPLLELVDPSSESCLETLLRLGMSRRGIGPVVPQFSPDGWQSVDFLVGGQLIVEADGAAFHDPVKDALRDARFRTRGFVVLRFTYDRIVDDLDTVLDEIEAALAEI